MLKPYEEWDNYGMFTTYLNWCMISLAHPLDCETWGREHTTIHD